jgi:hypothetical protein
VNQHPIGIRGRVAPQIGDPAAHHQQQAVGSYQQTIAQKIGTLDGSQRLFDPRAYRGWSVRQAPRIAPQQVIGYIGKVSVDTEFIQRRFSTGSSMTTTRIFSRKSSRRDALCRALCGGNLRNI